MLNKEQLLKALAGKTNVVNIEGLGEIEIKSLTFQDVQEIQAKELDGMESSLFFIIRGLVEPKLNDEDLESLKNSHPMMLFKIARVIQEISGMTEEKDFLNDGGQNS